MGIHPMIIEIPMYTVHCVHVMWPAGGSTLETFLLVCFLACGPASRFIYETSHSNWFVVGFSIAKQEKDYQSFGKLWCFRLWNVSLTCPILSQNLSHVFLLSNMPASDSSSLTIFVWMSTVHVTSLSLRVLSLVSFVYRIWTRTVITHKHKLHLQSFTILHWYSTFEW